MDLCVAAYIGSQPTYLRSWDAAVCTIEKANSLLNRAIDNGTFLEIGEHYYQNEVEKRSLCDTVNGCGSFEVNKKQI